MSDARAKELLDLGSRLGQAAIQQVPLEGVDAFQRPDEAVRAAVGCGHDVVDQAAGKRHGALEF